MAWLAVIIAPLLLQLVLLYVLSGAVNSIALRRLGKPLYLLLMWPGVVIHELSHLVGCIVTGTRVREVHLFSPRDEGRGNMVLGFVTHDKPRNPLASSVIGGAPFFGGAAALWALMTFMLPAVGRATTFVPVVANSATASAVFQVLGLAARRYAEFVLVAAGKLDWNAWQTYVFIYLAFSLAAHVAPSRADLKNASAGIFLGTILLVLAAYAGRSWAPELAASATLWFARAIGAVTVLLSFGLASLLAVAAFFLVVELAIAALSTGRRR